MGDLKITYDNILDHKGDFGQSIEIFNQPIDDFPRNFFNNSKAISLTLKRNKLSKLPSQLDRFKKLERLDLSNNNFEQFPEVIGDLENLRYLNISKNKLTSLPRDIIYLKKLEEIVLDDNLFEEFPAALFQSPVEDLSMRKNKLKSLPPGIKDMPNLQSLVVDNNQLTTLPVELAEMTKLTEVFASSNKIKGLPKNFCTKAKSLKKLALQENPLVYPSAISASKGMVAMRNYEKKHPRPDIPEDVQEQTEVEQNDMIEGQQQEKPEANGGDKENDETNEGNGVVGEVPEVVPANNEDVPAELVDDNVEEQVVVNELPESDRMEEEQQVQNYQGDSDSLEIPSEGSQVEEEDKVQEQVVSEEDEVLEHAVSEEPEADTMQESGSDDSKEGEVPTEENTGQDEVVAEESPSAVEESTTNHDDGGDQESISGSEDKSDQEEPAEVSAVADGTASQSSEEQSLPDDSSSAEMANGSESQPEEEQPVLGDESPAEVRDGDTGEVSPSIPEKVQTPATTTSQEDGDAEDNNERLI